MAKLKILKIGDETLRKVCRPVDNITPRVLTLLDDMVETMRAANGAGLAAPQVGVLRRIVVVETEEDGLFQLINPKIIAYSGEQETEEGCLSLLGGPRKTKRFEKIKVRWQNEAFQTRIKTFTGWTAQIIQHEIDHCNGILI